MLLAGLGLFIGVGAARSLWLRRQGWGGVAPGRHLRCVRVNGFTWLVHTIVDRCRCCVLVVCYCRDRFQRAFDGYCGALIVCLYFLYLGVVRGALSMYDLHAIKLWMRHCACSHLILSALAVAP